LKGLSPDRKKQYMEKKEKNKEKKNLMMMMIMIMIITHLGSYPAIS
jgi:flagellar basal body-associated protein FliL